MDERLVKVGKKIKKIKTSQQSQHDIIKEVLLDILDIIEGELKNVVKVPEIPKSEIKYKKEK